MKPIESVLAGGFRFLCLAAIGVLPGTAPAQSADWQRVIYREPQVRYLLADMCMGGNADLYRKYAVEEKDPDSREAIRLFDAGVRVVNTNDFERKWVVNPHGKEGRVMRIVFRGTTRTIHGSELLLTSDRQFQQGPMRVVLADLTLGRPVSFYESKRKDPNVAEALRRWADGVRVVNTHLFEARGQGRKRHVVFRDTAQPIDGSWVKLNSDPAYPETNVRYFMADIALGGGLEFYRRVAEQAHEMGCLEAVRRTEEGYQITNLDQFERKKVNGQTLITRKGSDSRMSGLEIKLSSD
jgi:hypothetical protein